ncbi:MAG TPA: SDR family oxidoreductase [Pseudonocardiaceae bacterium]|jgi:NADP-dependent 3-hydroxy acid dehydrogenase YdfG|nr:SDR family oxidoreductase [Pseudonocardiaceae bacterium]
MTARPVALVTGASRGIGAAVAEALAPTHRLLLGGRDEPALTRLAETLPSAAPLPMDLADLAGLPSVVAGIDRLDVLVHSAGTVTIASLPRTPVEVWRRTLDLNVIAVAELTRLLLPALHAATGQVVLINSGQGLRASVDWGAYAASKFALRAYADVLRAEEAASGLRVTTVFPGRTATDMQREVRAAEGGEFVAENYLRPESVADAVRFAIEAPPDAQLTELTLRPATRP